MAGALKLGLIFTLTDRVTAPLRGVRRSVEGITKATRAATVAVGNFTRSFRAVGAVGLAAGAAISVGIFRAVRQFADVGDAAQETSEKLGMSVLAFTRLSYAAKFSSIEAAALEDALKFLNLSSSQAADGSKQDALAFARLGVAYKDAHGNLRPLEAMLPEIADAFKKMEAGPRKNAIAMALFGRAGDAMIPLLNEGAEGLDRLGDKAEALGVAFDATRAQAAANFNNALDELSSSIFGLGNGIAGGLLPQLTSLITRLTQMIAANKPEVLRRMQAIFAQISASLPGIITGLSDFARFLGQIAAVLGPLITLIGGFSGVLDVLAVVMVTQVAVAIWGAVAAVWGLNGAMLANPIGLVIAAVAALVLVVVLMVKNWGQFSAFFGRMWVRIKAAAASAIGFLTRLFLNFSPAGLIIKHWASIVGWFQGLWTRIGNAFKAGVDAVWNMLPPWFRQVLRGASFVIRAVSGVGSPPGSGAGGSAGSPAAGRAQPAVGAAAAQRPSMFSGQFDFRHSYDGRPPVVTERGLSPGLRVSNMGAVTTRGGG